MSLYKQFWIFILLLLTATFLGSIIFSCISAKNYLEEHLTQKNNDNALALALSLSNGSQDRVSMELAISSQFDLGHYHFITLVGADGDIIATQYDDRKYREAPTWLIALFPIEIKPGVASVTNGWQQVGTLTLSSHERFAYKLLWDNAKQLANYFVLVSLIFCVLGSIALRRLSASLGQAVEQAIAIGDKRFITMKEPKILELRKLIGALNKLSEHVKQMLNRESAKLEELRRQMLYDEITGLYNRAPLLSKLSSFLQNKNETSHGALILVRLLDLFDLNQKKGRQTIDNLLLHMGKKMSEMCVDYAGQASAGRLNGSDFLLIIPLADEGAEKLAGDVYTTLHNLCKAHKLGDITLLISSTIYRAEENLSELLLRLDVGLQDAKKHKTSPFVFVAAKTGLAEKDGGQNWSQVLNQAFAEQGFALDTIPVVTAQETLLHWETRLTLRQHGSQPVGASMFMAHISRLKMNGKLDTALVQMAMASIKQNPRPLAIRLSANALANQTAMEDLAALIKQDSSQAHYLTVEFAEYNVFPDIEGLEAFCHRMRALNCSIGIANGGQEVKQLGKVHNLGLQYVKIDPFFIHNLQDTPANQVYLRGICTILHSIGLQAIAEGVTSADDWEVLKQLGFDGGSGLYLTQKS